MTRRIAIVGAREHPDLSIVDAYVSELAHTDHSEEHIEIVSGGAEGVDRRAQEKAIELGIVVHVIRPQNPVVTLHTWTEPGPEPTILHPEQGIALGESKQTLYRNTIIAAFCTEVTIFPEGSKGGCWDTAREARRFKRPVEVRHVDGQMYEYLGGMKKRSKGSWRQAGLF